MQINGPNFNPGVNSLGSSQQRGNVQRSNVPLGSGASADSVQFSSSSLLGTPSAKQHTVDFGAISNMSLDQAKSQLNPSTVFGLGLF